MVRGGRGRVVVGRLASLASVLVRPHRAATASMHSPTATTGWRTLAPSSPGRAACVGAPPPAPSLFSLHLGLSRGGGRRAAVHGGGRADRRQPGGAGAGRGDGRADEGAHGVRGGVPCGAALSRRGERSKGAGNWGRCEEKKQSRGGAPEPGPALALTLFLLRARAPPVHSGRTSSHLLHKRTHAHRPRPPPPSRTLLQPRKPRPPRPSPLCLFPSCRPRPAGLRSTCSPATPPWKPGASRRRASRRRGRPSWAWCSRCDREKGGGPVRGRGHGRMDGAPPLNALSLFFSSRGDGGGRPLSHAPGACHRQAGRA